MVAQALHAGGLGRDRSVSGGPGEVAGHRGARPVDAMNRYPPQLTWRRVRVQCGQCPVAHPPAGDDVSRVQHGPVADRDRAHVLRACVAQGLVEGCLDRPAVPDESAGALDFENQPFVPIVGKHDVGPADLEIDVIEGPIEHGR